MTRDKWTPFTAFKHDTIQLRCRDSWCKIRWPQYINHDAYEFTPQMTLLWQWLLSFTLTSPGRCGSWYLHLCCHRPNQHCKRRSQHRNSIRRAESSSTTLTQHGILQVNISATWKDKCYWYLFHWINLRKLHGIHKFCPSDVAARHTGVALAMIIIIILLIKQIDTLMESCIWIKWFQIYKCKQFLLRSIVTDVAGLIIFKNKNVMLHNFQTIIF